LSIVLKVESLSSIGNSGFTEVLVGVSGGREDSDSSGREMIDREFGEDSVCKF